MCGILGGVFNKNINTQHNFERGLDELNHRGPDDKGYEVFQVNDTQNLYLGHTRLAILDLTSAGHQPMTSTSGDITIVFNGEIYNYKELRVELEQLGYIFNTETDTEVLINAFEAWDICCLRKLKGMFAFSIFNHKLNKIILVRDAFGIKPLFYTIKNDRFVFSSEIAPMLGLLEDKVLPDYQSAYDYLVHGDYDSSERTFFSDIWHLMPASYIEYDLTTSTLSEQKRWWIPSIEENKSISFNEAAKEVKRRFFDNVRLHLRSDVPLGAALSGGLDSSAIVCAMRYLEPSIPIHTFSYIAKGSIKSEEKWVDVVNQSVNASSHKVVATPEELMFDLDDLIKMQGEPFGSASIYAQYRVFKLAKQHGITVTLDGQGADELLAGYIGYPGERLLSLFEAGYLTKALKFSYKWAEYPARSFKMAWLYFLRQCIPDFFYGFARKVYGRNSKPNWLNIEFFEKNDVVFFEKRTLKKKRGKCRRVIEALASSLYQRGLPGLLRHGDRNSMRFSIESRVPFLTIDLVEYLYSLPEDYLISDIGETKHVFREAMRDIVPFEILNRRDKVGFDPDDQCWKSFYVEQIKNTKTNAFDHLVDIKFFLSNLEKFDESVCWRLMNYIKWYNQFFETK